MKQEMKTKNQGQTQYTGYSVILMDKPEEGARTKEYPVSLEIWEGFADNMEKLCWREVSFVDFHNRRVTGYFFGLGGYNSNSK